MKRSKKIYLKLEELLIKNGCITQEQSNIICRRGHRKEWVWKRHILDLCEFVIEHKQPNEDVKKILKKAIHYIKMENK